MLKKSAAIVLALYSTVLVLSGLPTERGFAALIPFLRAPRQLLLTTSISPGLELFHRQNHEIEKLRKQCIIVHKTDSDSAEKKIGPGCVRSRGFFQWISDPYEILFLRFLEDIAVERNELSRRIGIHAFANQTRPNAREASLESALFDFICRQNKETREMSLLWIMEEINYVSGKLSRNPVLLLNGDCSSGVLAKVKWMQAIDMNELKVFNDTQI